MCYIVLDFMKNGANKSKKKDVSKLENYLLSQISSELTFPTFETSDTFTQNFTF